MVPKTHRFTVDDQVMLHLLGLRTQLVIPGDASIKRVAGIGLARPLGSQLRTCVLDSFEQRRHCPQQGIQAVAIAP
jgi:hypothetical protein